jgi:hypothetical protein
MSLWAWAMTALLAVQTSWVKATDPAVPDLTIKTQETSDHPNSSILTELLYRKGLRERKDQTVELPSASASAHLSTSITQCDQARTLLLNHEAKTYMSFPIEDPASAGERLRRMAGRTPSEPPATGPEVVIVIDSVDTGERRSFGAYVARRVIRTQKTEPTSGAATPAGLESTDGWYVDLPLPCDRQQGGREVLLGYSLQPGQPRDRIRFDVRGTAPLGYPIESTHRSETPFGTFITKRMLLEFSDAPLEASLFEIPATYRTALRLPGGGYDPARADTLANRLTSYWEVMVSWTRYWFR